MPFLPPNQDHQSTEGIFFWCNLAVILLADLQLEAESVGGKYANAIHVSP